ncbi:MAG: aminoacyl-histidine dipeptidase [Ruminococcaceae bacterium]|nr:aminoacyl-histidine dipeptidase [Oscillospiraceae bacterium]
MEYILSDLFFQSHFRYFEEICAIPHGSGNESQIADYLCDFAKKHNLEFYRDSINNVLIKKNATEGYEDRPAVLLQGHTDMVCEKNADTIHDFEKDGLKLYVKDGWLYADGTTLGADDGAAVAMMMAILSDNTLKHPPLECLFTVQEETGLCGAYEFDYSKLQAKRFINLDSETLHTATVSCAGGIRTEIEVPFDNYPLQNSTIKITVKGLFGGHSGVDINTGRENSIILMAKLLGRLYQKSPFNLVSINGGNKANAIPRECECIISVFDKMTVKEEIKIIANEIKKQLIKDDKKFTVRVDNANNINSGMLCFKDTSRVLSVLNLIPNGVYTMSKSMEGLVESSSNVGIISTNEKTVNLTLMPRSSNEAKMDEILMKIEMLCKLTGALVSHHDRYPGWEYRKDSEVREIFSKCYEEKFGKKAKFEAVHAGLECGIICSNMGGELDGISICAEVEEIHTPKERLDLQSLSDAYEITTKMLEQM